MRLLGRRLGAVGAVGASCRRRQPAAVGHAVCRPDADDAGKWSVARGQRRRTATVMIGAARRRL